MDYSIAQALISSSLFHLCALLAASMFFGMIGLRILRDEDLEGRLFIALSIFFFCAHLLYLVNLPPGNPLTALASEADIWSWLVVLLAPVLITVYLPFGLHSFLQRRVRPGLVKVFFGLTLLCYLYMVGQSWPIDVKGVLTLIWCLTWLNVEFSTAN
jgi:hypothetical protein